MYRLVYSVVFYLLLPLIFARLAWRALQAPEYRQRWGERLGFFPCPEKARDGIWFHTVSVGETIAAAPLVRRLQEALPAVPITMTTMTPTGSERVRTLFGDSVFHVYAPYDFPGAVKRFLHRVRPRMLVIMETELWPNMLYHAHLRGLSVYLVNARLSEKSARGYGVVGGLTREMLVCLEKVAVQTADEADRFHDLGLPRRRQQVTGSIKFDIQTADELESRAAQLRAEWGVERPVLVAASTHEGEDEQVLEALGRIRETCPQLLLVLVPRHPQRFDRVAALCTKAGFSVARRSRGETCGADTQIYLGDTMGELMMLFAACDIAFVGGSLVASGGHNMLEPAALGKPVLTGPSVFNFLEISRTLEQADALAVVDGPVAFANEARRLLGDEAARRLMGESGREVVTANRGALDRVTESLLEGWRTSG